MKNPDQSNSWLEFLQWYKAYGPTDSSLSEMHYPQHPILSSAMLMNRSIVAVVDVAAMKYIYWSGNVKEFIGYDDQLFIEGGVAFSFTKYHPDELAGLNCFNERLHYHYQTAPKKTKNLFRSFLDYRFQLPGGNYIGVLQQTSVIAEDEAGNMRLMLIFVTEVTHLKSPDCMHMYFTNGQDRHLCRFEMKQQKLVPLSFPSSREIDVFRLISQGFQRKQIAEKMGISLATVKTHCQHVFEKLHTNDSVETINLLKIWAIL